MKQPLGMRLFHATTSLLVLGVWLLASNHCALADLMPVQPEASHCHASPDAPAEEEEGECDGSKCCKSLSAPVAAYAKDLAVCDTALSTAVSFAAFEQRSFGSEHGAAIAEIDTGPPQGTSFAESVLQRSLLAHAPPVFA